MKNGYLVFFTFSGVVFLQACVTLPPFKTGFSEGLQTPGRSAARKHDAKHFKDPKGEPSSTELLKLIWPVKTGRLTQSFRDSQKGHWGIDIAAPIGTSIFAAHGGKVLYAGRGFKGYGKFVIIEEGEIATFYSHCHKIYVRQGERVEKGKLIGSVGRTGNASGPHLHFEVRKNRMPVDPMYYLPR